MGSICNDEKPIKSVLKESNIIQKYPLFSDDEIKNIDSFYEKIEIQNFDFGNNNIDKKNFDELKKYEIDVLSKEFNEKLKKFKDFFSSSFNSGLIDEIINEDLTEEIITKENTKNKFRDKIFQKIENIKENVEKYKIKYLTILLVGRKNVGKIKIILYII